MTSSRFTLLLLGMSLTLEAQSERRAPSMRPLVQGREYAVASMRPESTQVAERILRAGGNAFDAAVAGQAALALVDASNNGYGSDAMLLVWDAAGRKVHSINGSGTAPKLATIDWYKKNAGGKIPVSDTLLSATVPAVVDCWYILLDRWGTMTFADVLAPAIEMAEKGFPLGDRLAAAMSSQKLRRYPSSAKIYAPGGRTWKSGDIFTNPDAARMLRKLVEAERAAVSKGRREALKAARDRFYKGDIARTMAEFSAANGGLFRFEDFVSYTAKVEEPVSVSYRGYQVYKNPSANQGPAELFLLKMLEGYDLKAMGLNSAEYIHVSVEACKLSMADRDKYLSDVDFVRIPFRGLFSEEYAAERRKLIDPGKASFEFRPGAAEKFEPGFPAVNRPDDVVYSTEEGDGGDTSYIAVVDKDRNVVSFTPSLHTGFGTNVVMADLGFSFNCRGDYFSLVPGHANALEPGKRPRSTLQSTLVLQNGRPVLVTGSPGGDDQNMRTAQTFLNVVEFGMNIQRAIEAPRWSTRSFPQSYFPHVMYPGQMSVEDRIPQAVRSALIKKGHKLSVVGPWSLGSNAGITIHWDNGTLSAGADPRVDAYALSW